MRGKGACLSALRIGVSFSHASLSFISSGSRLRGSPLQKFDLTSTLTDYVIVRSFDISICIENRYIEEANAAVERRQDGMAFRVLYAGTRSRL